MKLLSSHRWPGTSDRAPLPSWLRTAVLLAVCALALAALGCRGSSDVMRPSTASGITPVADAATVVFIRPSAFAGAIVTTIIDGHGRFLGEAEPESYFVARVPAGEHVFIAWSEGTPALRAKLAPGKVYFVEVAPKMGAWSARVQLLALKTGSENWKEVPGWLRESQALVANDAAAKAKMAERADDVRETVQSGAEKLREYDAEDLALRTLVETDGIDRSPNGAPAAAAAPAVAAAPEPVAAAAPAPVAPVAAAPAAAAPAAAPATAATPATARLDVVRLKAGGRVQGKVMEDDPNVVSIQLADGTVKRLKRSDVDRVDYGQ